MPVELSRRLIGDIRTRKADIQLGILLAFVAGGVNAGGFLAVGYYTSHMTGIVSSIGDYIALNRFTSALVALFFLLSFIAGAVTSSFLINKAKENNIKSGFAIALMLEAFLLLLFGLYAPNILRAYGLSVSVTVCLLCFMMGLQNAIITKISNAEIRTTHVTGISTDIGIEIGRYLCARDNKESAVVFNPKKLKIHISLLLSFLLGGIVGAISFKHIGFIATVPLAMLLALLASVPIWDDIKAQKSFHRGG